MNDATTGSTNAQASTSTSPSLLRVLGPRIAIAVVVGNVIGSGIYLKPGSIAAAGGNFWLIISVWIFGGVLCILGGLCFAELGTMLPRAGGMYVYLKEGYGRPVAFLFGWTDFLIRLPGSIAALSVAFVGKLFLAFGWEVTSTAEVLMSFVLIGSMAGVNIVGVLWGGRLQMFFTVIKVATLALVAAAPLLLIPFVGDGINVANYSTTIEPTLGPLYSVEHDATVDGGESASAAENASAPTLLSRIGVILLAVMWAYNGWHGITPLAEEVRNPQRNIPLALLGGIGILIVLYLAANFAYHGVLSMSEMAAAGEDAAERMLDKLVGSFGVIAVAGVIMCSTFGAINTNFLQAPRIPFAMGRDGTFFRGLGHVHANYHTPAVAIFVSAVMAVLLIFIGALGQYLARDVDPSAYSWEITRKVMTSLRDGGLFDLLTNFVIFAASIFYTLAALAVIILRIRRPDLERPYKTLGYPLVPLVFVLVYVVFLTLVYLENPLEAHAGLLFIALGIPAYFIYQRWSTPREPTE